MSEAREKAIKLPTTNRAAWLIERSSIWGTEWFCSGTHRWTKDANKAIQFPDKASAEETWFRLLGDENQVFPYVESSIEADYNMDVTEHAWIDRYAACESSLRVAERLIESVFGILGSAERITFENGNSYYQDEFGWRPDDPDGAFSETDILNCGASMDIKEILTDYAKLVAETEALAKIQPAVEGEGNA